jgi:tRNA-dihydrouridine synthase
MIGRGACGRPWIATAIDKALNENSPLQEPAMPVRLAIALEHLHDTMAFYGDGFGLKIFRKHLAAYIEHAPYPVTIEERRIAKGRLCQIASPVAVEKGLVSLWMDG